MAIASISGGGPLYAFRCLNFRPGYGHVVELVLDIEMVI